MVIAGKMAGEPNARIALEAGCSERHVDRLAAEPETRLSIQALLQKRAARIDRMVGRAMDAIEAALTATLPADPGKAARIPAAAATGLETPVEPTYIPDHDTRLRAADQLRKWVELLAENQVPGGEEGEMSIDRFVVLYERKRAAAKDDSKTIEGSIEP